MSKHTSKELISSSDSDASDDEVIKKKAKKPKVEEEKSKSEKHKSEKPKSEKPKSEKPKSEKPKSEKSKRDEDDDDGSSGWEIGKTRKVTINDFRGRALVDIREYYEKDGKFLPGKKGISLSPDQWQKLKDIIPKVDKALGKL